MAQQARRFLMHASSDLQSAGLTCACCLQVSLPSGSRVSSLPPPDHSFAIVVPLFLQSVTVALF